jgi:hypothetical protein
MAVGIEPEAMSEARLPREVLFGHALNVVDEAEYAIATAKIESFDSWLASLEILSYLTT